MTLIFLINIKIISRASEPAELDYDERSACEGALRPLCERAYSTCRLFNGPLADALARCGPDALRAALAHALAPFVAELDVGGANVFDALHGIQFLPVEKNVYLRVQSFVNLAEQTFATIDETAVLFREHLIWSGFDQPTTRILYTLLAHRLRRTKADTPHLLAREDCDALASDDGNDGSDGAAAESGAAGGDTSVDGAAPLVRGMGDRRLYVWQVRAPARRAAMPRPPTHRPFTRSARALFARGCCAAAQACARCASGCAPLPNRTRALWRRVWQSSTQRRTRRRRRR